MPLSNLQEWEASDSCWTSDSGRAVAVDQWFTLSCLLGTARKFACLVYMCSVDLMKAYYRVLLTVQWEMPMDYGVTRSVVMGCSVPVWMHSELRSHSRYCDKRFRCGCCTPPRLFCLWSCFWFSRTGSGDAAKAESVSNLGASEVHLCFSQMM